MSAWVEFLHRLNENENRFPGAPLTLVGPLCEREYRADGPTIYVDGGVEFRPADGGSPADAASTAFSISVGDGDSAVGPLDLRLPRDKDVSDLGFVLRELPLHVRTLRLLGFLGGRRDHELACLGEVHRFLAARVGVENGVARVDFWSTGEADKQPVLIGLAGGSLQLQIEGLFSVFVVESSAVKIGGECKFSFTGELNPLSSHGLSNEGSGVVSVDSSSPAFILIAP